MLEIIAAATLVTVCLASVGYILYWTSNWAKFQCKFNSDLLVAERKRSDDLEKKLVLVSWENCKQYTDARETYERDVLQRIANLYQRMQDHPVTVASPAAPVRDLGTAEEPTNNPAAVSDSLLTNIPDKDIRAWAEQYGTTYEEMKDLAERASDGTLTAHDTERFEGQVPEFIADYLPGLDEDVE